MRTRANSDQDKQAKHEMIIKATMDLFAKDREIHTATAIAKEAKVGKGTVYTYFRTKEEIYMEAVVNNFSRWHEAVRDYVLSQSPSSRQAIEYLCRSLTDFTVFVDLISIASSVLEENLEVDYIVKARKQMRAETLKTCEMFAGVFPEWKYEAALRNFRRF